MIDPFTIITQRDGGTADMGNVTQFGTQSDVVSRVARFWRPGRFAFVWARIHFGGSGTGTATLTLKLDSNSGTQWDTTLWTWEGSGAGADVHFRIPADELMHWVFAAGDELVFEWTNPDSGNITWGIEVGLLDATE